MSQTVPLYGDDDARAPLCVEDFMDAFPSSLDAARFRPLRSDETNSIFDSRGKQVSTRCGAFHGSFNHEGRCVLEVCQEIGAHCDGRSVRMSEKEAYESCLNIHMDHVLRSSHPLSESIDPCLIDLELSFDHLWIASNREYCLRDLDFEIRMGNRARSIPFFAGFLTAPDRTHLTGGRLRLQLRT